MEVFLGRYGSLSLLGGLWYNAGDFKMTTLGYAQGMT